MNILDLIAKDENVAPAFRRIVASPKQCATEAAHAKAEVRKFAEVPEPVTAFGEIGTVGSARWRDVRDQCQADAIWDAAHEVQE